MYVYIYSKPWMYIMYCTLENHATHVTLIPYNVTFYIEHFSKSQTITTKHIHKSTVFPWFSLFVT